MIKLPAFLICLFFYFSSWSQCRTALPTPACTGVEPLVTDGAILNQGTTKWYYGAATMINSLTLNGGTLVVCGDLTVDKFYMDSGTVYIRPGGRFVIGSGIGAGLILRGNSAIYNYGVCELQRNLSLDNGWSSAAKPNLVINATGTSFFKMSNQYLVINDAHSFFVNQGRAEFWGIINDPQSTAGCVCLGGGSSTKMAVLINKVADTYTAPEGNACLQVLQFSEFYGRLTSSPTLFTCLGVSHTSSSGCIPFGCVPNNWGASQVFTNCMGCGAIAVLTTRFDDVKAEKLPEGNRIRWEMSAGESGQNFRLLRSADGQHFEPLVNVGIQESDENSFSSIDKNPLEGDNYYMIRFINAANGSVINSKAVKVTNQSNGGLNLYPVPFENKFYINYADAMTPERILLTDATGRDVRTSHSIHPALRLIEVIVLDRIQPGIYIVHMRTDRKVVAKTIFKQ